MPSSPLNLDEADFWGDFTRTEDEFDAWVEKESFVGLRVDAPALVATDRRETVPLVGYYVRTLREDRQVDSRRQTIAVALNLGTKRLHTGLALDTGKIRPPPDPMPDDDPGEGLALSPIRSELRGALGLPWSPSRYLVALLLRDHVSNSVVIEIGAAKSAYRDPEVEKFLAQQRKNEPVVPPQPIAPEAKAETGVSYKKLSQSPPIPAQPGIALAIERVALRRAGVPCMCYGTFKLPVVAGEVVRRDKSGAAPDVGDAQATAIVPIALVATGSETAGPFVIEVRAPTYDAVPGAKELDGLPADREVAVVTGHFSLDLFQQPSMPLRAETYFFTAFGGACANGPVPVAVVTQSMLR
jgi:hypothetical protein